MKQQLLEEKLNIVSYWLYKYLAKENGVVALILDDDNKILITESKSIYGGMYKTIRLYKPNQFDVPLVDELRGKKCIVMPFWDVIDYAKRTDEEIRIEMLDSGHLIHMDYFTDAYSECYDKYIPKRGRKRNSEERYHSFSVVDHINFSNKELIKKDDSKLPYNLYIDKESDNLFLVEIGNSYIPLIYKDKEGEVDIYSGCRRYKPLITFKGIDKVYDYIKGICIKGEK